MWAWLRELHEILDEVRERRTRCNTCEVLEREISNLRREKEVLLQKVLSPPEISDLKVAPEPLPVPSRYKPWRMKQQELEKEDAIQAERIRKEFAEKVAAAEQVMGVEK